MRMSPEGGVRFDVYRDLRGKWHWKLLASNSKPIAISPKGYKSKWNCLYSLRLIAAAANGAPIWNQDYAVWE